MQPSCLLTNGVVSTLATLSAKNPDKYTCKVWLPTHKPMHDMLAETEPEFIFAPTQHIPDISDGLKEYPNTKLVLLGQTPCRHTELKPALWCATHNVGDVVAKNVNANKIEVISPAANLARFNRGKLIDKYKVDIVYVSSEAEIKPGELDILSILSGSNFRFRIIGMHRPFIQYVGLSSAQTTSNYFASASIVLDIRQQISFDVATQGGFAISTEPGHYPHIDIKEIDKDKILKTLQLWLDKPQDRIKMGKATKKKVFKSDTYFHRVAQIFASMGHSDIAKDTLNTLKTLSKEIINV